MSDIRITERDIKDAEKFRAAIHREALEKLRERYPDITEVVDLNPIDSYFCTVWDYPGEWYLMVAVPERYRSRDELVREIVRNTTERYLSGK